MNNDKTVGFAMCGSHCSFAKCLETLAELKEQGYDILPIMSENAYKTDTRFGAASYFVHEVKAICGHNIIHTIKGAEPLGPSIKLDALIISPCTGNTLAKIANGITDTSVTMAVKAHTRNNRPVVIALATNDALGANLKNIGMALERKNIYFVPLGQDDPVNKPHSLIADFDMVNATLDKALEGIQIQPLLTIK
jgi:dipicolinate synthase subunit B